MIDVELSGKRKNIRALFCESRAILELLGFSGISDFAKRAGVNHETAGAVLGTCKLKYHKHHYNVVKVHEALHTAYEEQRERLTPPARAYVCDWAKRWRDSAVSDKMMIESPGKIGESTSAVVLLDRKRKRDAVLKAVKQALNSLEWKP